MKTNLILVGLSAIVSAIAFGVYYRTLQIGFLLDDFYHIDYLMKAFDGDNSELMKVIFGSWSGPTGLNSFRPLTTVGLLADFLLWKTNAFGFHLTNLILYAACSSCVVVLVSQMLVNTRERLYASFFAGLLFVLYPIHPESVAWIIGRVDTQCVLFFLLSLISYFQFRKSENHLLLILSFVFFFVSLTTKEMAVVLPVVVLASEFLLANDMGFKQKGVLGKIMIAGSYFAFLAVFAIVRTTAIGTLVGGYGSTDLKSTLLSFNNFFDMFTLKKILFGVNDELPLKSNPAVYVYASILLSLFPIVLAIFSKRTLRLVSFLILFLLVSVIPTFQIWHIYPNLVGSRLFFLGSVPFVVLLAVICFSPYDNVPSKFRKPALSLRCLSVLGLLALSCFWYIAVDNNLQVWRRAGEDIEGIRKHLTALSKNTGGGKFIYLIDLPQDDSGAGLIGRPEYLQRMLKLSEAPLSDEGKYQQIITSEPRLSRARNFLYPHTLKNLILSPDVKHKLRWNPKLKSYDFWNPPEGTRHNSYDENGVQKEKSGLIPISAVKENGELSISKKQIVWFPVSDLNPFSVAWIKLKYSSKSDASSGLVRARLLFKSSEQPESWIDYSTGPEADITKAGELLFVPYRYRSWLLNGKVKELGIEFTYVKEPIEIENSVSFGGPYSIFPLIALSDSSYMHTVDRQILLPCDSISPLNIIFDVRAIDGAQGAMVMVGKSQIPIAVPLTRLLPNEESLLFKKKVMKTKGTESIPDELISKEIGLHQVAVMAIDKEGEPIGFLSEPKLFEICPNRPPVIK